MTDYFDHPLRPHKGRLRIPYILTIEHTHPTHKITEYTLHGALEVAEVLCISEKHASRLLRYHKDRTLVRRVIPENDWRVATITITRRRFLTKEEVNAANHRGGAK